jgi:hypothetical protein
MKLYRLSVEQFINNEFYERYKERFNSFEEGELFVKEYLKENSNINTKKKKITNESFDVTFDFNDARGFVSKHRLRLYPFELKTETKTDTLEPKLKEVKSKKEVKEVKPKEVKPKEVKPKEAKPKEAKPKEAKPKVKKEVLPKKELKEANMVFTYKRLGITFNSDDVDLSKIKPMDLFAIAKNLFNSDGLKMENRLISEELNKINKTTIIIKKQKDKIIAI